MAEMPGASVRRWAAGAVDADGRVEAIECLHEVSNAWRLCIRHAGRTSDAVLRIAVPGWIGEDMIATGAAALQVAGKHGLAASRLLASDLDGHVMGLAMTLETALPGSSASPPRVSAERLRQAGAAIAKVHAVPLAPARDLPFRTRATQVDDHARDRRWATVYRACPESEKPAVIEGFRELTGVTADAAREAVSVGRMTGLLQLADEVLRARPVPQGQTVFVHGDIWAGNMLWDGDACLALIDWKTAGVGDPGVDLGHLRMKMAVQYGPDAATHVLEGWQRESGRDATNLPYWDTVAAASTPAELSDHEPCFDPQGNPVDTAAVTKRRDAFLRAALDRLQA